MRPTPRSAHPATQHALRYALPVALPAGAAICSGAATASHGAGQLLWAVGAIAATTATAALSVWKDRASASAAYDAAESRARLANTLTRAAEPMVNALATVTAAPSPEQRRIALEVLISLVIDHTHTQCWLPEPATADVRATFYELVGGHLLRRRTAGRADTPRPDFRSDRSYHDHEAIRLAHGEHPLIVHDLHEAPPAHFQDSKGRTYRSFIAAPVRAGADSYGLLVIDADQPNTFTPTDKHHVLLMCAILGAGFAHLAATASQPITPCPLHLTPTCEQTREVMA